MAKWKKKETAPNDGTPILVCNPDYDTYQWGIGPHPRTVSFRIYHPNAAGKPTWRDTNDHKDENWTHWMPLPKAPLKEK